jgi:hypothetical protein
MVVGPAREAPHPVRLRDPPAQHDHRQVRVDPRRQPARVAHAVEEVKAGAAALEREVQHDQVRPPHPRSHERPRPHSKPRPLGSHRRRGSRGGMPAWPHRPPQAGSVLARPYPQEGPSENLALAAVHSAVGNPPSRGGGAEQSASPEVELPTNAVRSADCVASRTDPNPARCKTAGAAARRVNSRLIWASSRARRRS